MQIAKLPAAALGRYRQRVDALADEWYREGLAARDEALLRRVVDEAYCSSSGDDSLLALGELALERADYAAARRNWRQISPQLGGGNWLAYPDSDLDLASVRARLVLASIRAGELTRAQAELAQLRKIDAQAAGRLAGQDGPLVPALERLLTTARAWREPPRSSSWPTFAGSATRGGVGPAVGAITGPSWREAVKFPSATSAVGPAIPDSQRVPYQFPVVAAGRVYFADAAHVYAAVLADGRPAITTDGVLYREPERASEYVVLLGGWATAWARNTLTLLDHVLFARVGPPATARFQADDRGASDWIVGLDVARDGLLAFRARPEDRQWSCDGVPVGDGRRVYVAARRSDVNPQAAVVCFDAATGRQVWRTSVGSANSPGAIRGDEITHNLLTLVGERIYFNTNCGLVAALRADDGAICWLREYERSEGPHPAAMNALPAHFRRDPSPAIDEDGVLLVAPSDTPKVFAFDAETGGEIWSTGELADAVQLLGVVEGNLIASGDQLWCVDVRTGHVRWTRPGDEGQGARGMGRGVIAGQEVFWPTQKEIYVFDAASGAPTRAPISLAAVGESGANLVAAEGYLIAAGFDRMMAYGREGQRGSNDQNSRQ
jgi:outer membrane protein assembly factor BamB